MARDRPILGAMSARLRLGTFACVVALLLSAAAPGREDDEVSQKINATVAALAASGFVLSDADFAPTIDEPPPPAVVESGDAFVAAWREYRRALSIRDPALPAVAVTPAPYVRDAATREAAYARNGELITRLLDGDDPPTPDELSAGLAYAGPVGGCGNPMMQFSAFERRAVLLANLRHRRYGEAARIALGGSWSVNPQSTARGRVQLLTALGFDWRRVLTGAWLEGTGGALETLIADPSDETAQLALAWAQRQWDAAVAYDQERREGRYRDLGPEPKLPQHELIELLASDAVTEETKQRIADFLNANATRLQDEAYWLSSLPPGTAVRLQPLARAALQHDTNRVRRLGMNVLRDAGVTPPETALRADPMYRVFLDGVLWEPNSDSGTDVSITYANPGVESGGSFTMRQGGVIVVDADAFARLPDIRRASIGHSPTFGMWETPRLDVPWFGAPIPLPPAFGEITDLQVQTTTLTIRPRFRRPLKPGQEIDIGITNAPPSPDRDLGWHQYRSPANKPLVLSNLQRGPYWVRVRAEGAALGDWQRVDATAPAVFVSPAMAIGASVYIPITWPPGVDEYAKIFDPLDDAFTVERNGQVCADCDRVSANNGEGPDYVVMRYLPIGTYRARFQPTGGRLQTWSFSITRRSPPEITLRALDMPAAD